MEEKSTTSNSKSKSGEGDQPIENTEQVKEVTTDSENGETGEHNPTFQFESVIEPQAPIALPSNENNNEDDDDQEIE